MEEMVMMLLVMMVMMVMLVVGFCHHLILQEHLIVGTFVGQFYGYN